MRADAVITQSSTADWYTASITSDNLGNQSFIFTFKKKIAVTLLDGNSPTPAIFTKDKMGFNDQLRNVFDRNGVSILANGDNVEPFIYVGLASPVMNVFQELIGYRYILTRTFNT